MIASVCVIFFVISSVFGSDEAKLRFYHESFDNYTELSFDKAPEMFHHHSKWYNPSKWTIIFCHGFTGHPLGPAVTAIMKAYLKHKKSNVILLNWEHLAASVYGNLGSSYVKWAVPNAFMLGSKFADTLMDLSGAGLNLNKTHLVGHSLGGQIMGMVGNNMAKKGVVMPWITGLDPAGILFDAKHPFERLNPNSALFVDVIHSDPNKYGSRKSLGTVDFWPNYRSHGQVNQPGCENKPSKAFTQEDLCNHNKCWEYLIDTMVYPETILGCYAKNYRAWKNYSPEERKANFLELGKFAPNATPGDYYFTTAGTSPFGLGEEGL